MGEIAEMMLNGDLDCETGEWLGQGDGYPRTFGSDLFQFDPTPKKPKDTACPKCQKKVRGIEAVHQHMKDKHNITKKHERDALLKGLLK